MAARPIGQDLSGSGRWPGRVAQLFAAAVVVLFPAVASACPVCAGRADAGPMRGVFLAMFIFFPFALVYGVIRYMRSQALEAEQSHLRPAAEDMTVNERVAGRSGAPSTPNP